MKEETNGIRIKEVYIDEAQDNAFGEAASKLLRKPITRKGVESTTAHVRPRVKDKKRK